VPGVGRGTKQQTLVFGITHFDGPLAFHLWRGVYWKIEGEGKGTKGKKNKRKVETSHRGGLIAFSDLKFNCHESRGRGGGLEGKKRDRVQSGTAHIQCCP